MSPRRASELMQLRKLADELAKRKHEKTTTTHLLAAIAQTPGAAADLLAERRLLAEVVLSATRATTDDGDDAVERALRRAQEMAARTSVSDAGSLHLLFALCQERSFAAHRAIAQCGADVPRLRAAAMQLLMGLVGPRRVVLSHAASRSTRAEARPLPHAAPSPRAPSPRTSLPVRSSPPPSPPSKAPTDKPTASRAPTVKPPPTRGTAAPSSFPVRPVSPRPVSPRPASPRAAAPASSALPPGARAGATTPSSARLGAGVHPMMRAAHGRGPTLSRSPSTPPPVTRFALDAKRFPLLHQLGRNLTLAAAQGELDPVVERELEIERTLDVLAKRQGNSPVLVGVAGVGKTSIVRGLARRIAEGRVTSALDDRVVVEVDAGQLVAGTGVRGALAERITTLRNEVAKGEGRIVVFFDEIHRLFGPEAGDEAAGELRRALAKGELPCIGATTPEDYRKSIESDTTLARRFSPVEVVELSTDASLAALAQLAPSLENHHGTRYLDDAVAGAVRWSARYLPDRALPDKAVAILDLAGARAKRRSLPEVDVRIVANVVAELAGVPEERLLETDAERMLRLEETLASRVVGHTAAIERIARVLRRNASGLRSKRPIGTFLLLGPTGVGKTEMAKAIAASLFHSPLALTRLDLSEYAEPHAVARLVGAPPGYVGHEAGGQLTEAVRRRPYQVILLDEIEKAHRDVLEAFLQVFDEGRMTDGRGRTVDFTSTVIVLTSNLGADIAVPTSARTRIGFSASAPRDDAPVRAYETAVLAAAREGLPPELYNRFDEVIAFAPLDRANVTEIARRLLETLANELLAARGVRLAATDRAIDALLDRGGFDPTLGARPMRRAIARFVEAPVSELLLRGEVAAGGEVLVDVEAGELVVRALRPAGVA